MTTQYGLTAFGFAIKSQAVIKAEIEDALRGVFGQNINLSAESNFGQFVGIMSGREALLWQLALAVYSSQYPGGAEGASVDNILALNNLRRLAASPTRTDSTSEVQANGVTRYGLLLRGTPGTSIPAGSIVQTDSSPPLQFTTDSPVTIAAALNALQTILFSNTPTMGGFTLTIEDPSGNTLGTSSIPYNVLASTTQLGFSAPPSTGAFTLTMTKAGVASPTASIPYTANAAAIQVAVRAVSGYEDAVVTGSYAAGMTFDWGAHPNPLLTVSANTLGVTTTVIDGLQAKINALYDAQDSKYPYTDVTVTGSFSGFNIAFGANTPADGQDSSAEIPQPRFVVGVNSLQNSTTVTNLNILITQQGAPAQVAATATCTENGPNFVAAGSINTVGSSVAGWTGVINELDCISGTNAEDDTEALLRRQNQLEAQANGPLASIIDKVAQVEDVTNVIGFENVNESALQVITFDIPPTSGSFSLIVGGQNTAGIAYNATAAQVQTAIRALSGYENNLVTGDNVAGFTVDFNGDYGGQPQEQIAVGSNTTGSAIIVEFGRPGKSFEIVAQGGTDNAIANKILGAKPAGIQAYGSTEVVVYDNYQNPYTIGFSRPVPVPFYVVIDIQTDLAEKNPKFNPQSISTIQQDIVALGNAVGIGGLVIGFGTNGLIGAFNDVPGIRSYTLYFGRNPNPVSNANIQLQPEESPNFESFNVQVSYV